MRHGERWKRRSAEPMHRDTVVKSSSAREDIFRVRVCLRTMILGRVPRQDQRRLVMPGDRVPSAVVPVGAVGAVGVREGVDGIGEVATRSVQIRQGVSADRLRKRASVPLAGIRHLLMALRRRSARGSSVAGGGVAVAARGGGGAAVAALRRIGIGGGAPRGGARGSYAGLSPAVAASLRLLASPLRRLSDHKLGIGGRRGRTAGKPREA
mmetsp:Transcript_21493/g.73600  ORF Transcript_21493/g.73600 Transcript_21493/m.73600 type:complete len:210 (-) Transcript_21493:1809-2438(-)